MSIFALALLGACGVLAFCFFKIVKQNPHILPSAASLAPVSATAPPTAEQLAAMKLRGPRDSARVREELVEALSKAEELKSELDRIMQEEMGMTGPSMLVNVKPAGR